MSHKYFADVDFKLFATKEIPAPYIPQLSEDIFDVTNFEVDFQREEGALSVAPKGNSMGQL